jgi:hypothetical protein
VAPAQTPCVWKLDAKFVSLIGHSAAAGALPTLFAATSPNAKPAGDYGSNGVFEFKESVAASIVSLKAKTLRWREAFGRYQKS